MKKIKDIKDALVQFELNMITYGETPDYRKANKAYDNCRKIVKYLLENNAIDSLKFFYESENLWVRLSAATYLAPINSGKSYEIVKEIASSRIKGISVDAEFCLKEWPKLSDPKVYDRILAG